MQVKVEACYGGSDHCWFRLTLSDGRRIRLQVSEGQGWDRKVATSALNLLEIEFPGIPRKQIRFVHH